MFYRTYHLAGIETPVAIASAVIEERLIGAPLGRVADVVVAAKRKLAPDDELDGGVNTRYTADSLGRKSLTSGDTSRSNFWTAPKSFDQSK